MSQPSDPFADAPEKVSAVADAVPDEDDPTGETMPPDAVVVPADGDYDVQPDDEQPDEDANQPDPYADPAVQQDGAPPEPPEQPSGLRGASRPTAAAVLARAVHYHDIGFNWGVGHCLMYAHTAAYAPAGTATAARGWANARYKHRGDARPPAGVPVWWLGGSHGYGHVAISAGNGYIWSTDVARPGRVDKVPLSWIGAHWNQHYVGWSEDINGVRIAIPTKPVPPPRPTGTTVDLSVIADAARRGVKASGVQTVQAALRAEVGLDYSSAPGTFGPMTRKAYAAWQAKCGLRPYDGIPGMTSLSRLGTRHGFGVRA